jgi:hypothetical protein
MAFHVFEQYGGKHTVALPWRRIQYLYWQHIYLNNTENNNKNKALCFIIIAVCIVEILQDWLFT